jgi:L,D-peptidoglycan transpeptidase YkuD (ErfK/YbiS/YcfS/YnhG family)
MEIIVTAAAPDAPRHRGILTAGGQGIDCALGKGGITRDKREGDGATPCGRLMLRRVLYRADRLARPNTKLPCTAIATDDGWCDDPANPDYNRPIRFPFDASAEHLWRDDALYDLIVVLGHNDDPPQPGAGSAIFLHVARDGLEPTEGCVAIPRAALIALVGKLAPGDVIVISGTER